MNDWALFAGPFIFDELITVICLFVFSSGETVFFGCLVAASNGLNERLEFN
jgi:hypothetical protein